MILPSNYDEIDFDALYKAQKARSSFGKKIAADWDKKAPSFNEGVMKSAYAREFIDKVDFTGNLRKKPLRTTGRTCPRAT